MPQLIEPVELLVVEPDALASQQQAKTTIALAAHLASRQAGGVFLQDPDDLLLANLLLRMSVSRTGRVLPKIEGVVGSRSPSSPVARRPHEIFSPGCTWSENDLA